MPRRVSSIDPAKFHSTQNFWWTHAAGKNTAKPHLIQEMKKSHFKPKKSDDTSISELTAIDESSLVSEDMNDEGNEQQPQEPAPEPVVEPEPAPPQPVPEPVEKVPDPEPEQIPENGVEEEERCICNDNPESKGKGGHQQDDMIKQLVDKVAELQNSLTYCEVENIRLEGCISQLKLDNSRNKSTVHCLEETIGHLNKDKDSLGNLIETVEHNAMKIERENRDLRVEKIMWESEKRRLENSLEEARAESRLLDSQVRSYNSTIRHSSPRSSALDASLGVIDDLNLKIERLSSENTTLNTLYERAKEKAREAEDENRSLRREKMALESSLEDARADSRFWEDRVNVSRSLSPIPMNTSFYSTTSNPQDLCETCKCRHSNPKKICPTCGCAHKNSDRLNNSSTATEVCPVCYFKWPKCPRSPKNVKFSEYASVHPDLSRTF